jgi:hypothetical protein
MSRRSFLGRLGLLGAGLVLPALAGCTGTATSGAKANNPTPTAPNERPKENGQDKLDKKGAEPIVPPKHDPPDR